MEILNFPVGFFLSVYKNGNFPVGFYSTLFLPCHIFLFIESLNLQNKAKSINSLTMNKQYVKYCKFINTPIKTNQTEKARAYKNIRSYLLTEYSNN